MSILTNPVTISVIVLCVLSLLKLNVLLAMLVACIAGGLAGGIPIYAAKGDSVMSLLTSGFSGNATTALAYILLGTFATAIATTGLADIVSKKLSKIIGTKKLVLLGMITLIACLSQNLIPIHIAYIPILIPPMLVLMNKMRLDRRAVACCLAFGHKAPYIAIPFGFGLIFQTIISDNLTANGMEVTVNDVAKVNWVLAVAMLIGLLIAVFVLYRKPRDYQMIEADTSASDAVTGELGYRHFTTNKREITCAADMKGQSIRVQEAPIWFALTDCLGATATPVAFNELYTALSQGMVDGQENPIPSIASSKFYEVQKYMCLDGHTYGAESILINLDYYNTLPAEIQTAIDEAAAYAGEQQRAAVSANEAAQLQQIKDAGVIVCEDPDITSFQEATAELYLRPEVQAIVSPELTEMVRSAAEAAAK